MSTIAASARLTELAAIVGEEHVVETPSRLKEFAIDNVVPAISVSPGSAQEVSAVLKYAYERDLVVSPCGGFVHQEIGNAPAQIDILLRTERLTAIEHYDPGDLTIGVGSGVSLSDLQSLVRDQGQMFPVDIPHADRVTLGGAMAVAAQGPMKHFFGGLREFCIGVRFVTADGVFAKGGGRVVKNVAGFDLMKLMIGSYGTLAVITSASFKLFPQPHGTRTFVCEFGNISDAIAFRDTVLGSPLSPLCLELLSPTASPGSAWTIAIRAGASERVLGRYATELGSAVTKALDGAEEQKFWADVIMLGEHAPVVVAIKVPPAVVADTLSTVQYKSSDNGVNVKIWGRAAIGTLYFSLDGGMAENYIGVVQSLRSSLPNDASAVVTRCPSALKPEIHVWGHTPTHLDAMRAVKRALNPKDTLNPGRFLV